MKKKFKAILKQIINLLPPRQRLMILRFFWTREQKVINSKRKKFYISLLGDNKLYFDVGANVGNRIEPIVLEDVNIVAVEPQPLCISRLQTKFGNSITIEPIALGECDGDVSMYVSEAHTVSSLSKDFIERTKNSGRFKNISWNDKIEVQVKTLESLIDAYGMPGLVKIDVEGYENMVLKGLESEVPVLSFEYTLPEMRDRLKLCFDEVLRVYKNGFYMNYSQGEDLIFGLTEWIHSSRLEDLWANTAFINSGFGDIYIRRHLR